MLEEIQDRLDAVPFTPFQLVLASGDRFDVRTPNQLVLGEAVSYFTPLDEEAIVVIRNNQMSHIVIKA